MTRWVIYIGAKGGTALFKNDDAKFFKKKYIDESHAFFEKHGPITIILARFVPIVRTFAPVVAGASKMKYSLFLTYNIVGGILWGAGVTMLGYFLGQIQFIRDNVDYIFILSSWCRCCRSSPSCTSAGAGVSTEEAIARSGSRGTHRSLRHRGLAPTPPVQGLPITRCRPCPSLARG